jgi:Histidine kinase
MIARLESLTQWFVQDLRWLGGMSWRRVGWLLAVAAVLALSFMPSFVISDTGLDAPGTDYVAEFVGSFAQRLISYAPILLALTVADNIRATGVRRAAVLIAALLVGAQVAAIFKCLLPLGYVCAGFSSGRWKFRMFTEDGMWTVIIGGLMALAYFQRRHDLGVTAALHAAEVARADVQRETLGADLQAMQARVEPVFLFETLGKIGELYDRDPATGERILDELIAYLRAALPDLRGSSSTLGREVELARSYFAILDLDARCRLAFDFNAAPDVSNIVVPPMIILPLLSAALSQHNGASAPATSIRLDARSDRELVRIVLSGAGAAIRALDGCPIVGDTRERLRVLYGGRATLAIDASSDQRLVAVIEIPHESA